MEFFGEVSESILSADDLKSRLTLANMSKYCASIYSVEITDDVGVCSCLWGEHRFHREELRDGVLYWLSSCPNAVTFSITADPERSRVIVHCTINRKEHDADFIESIEEFVAGWVKGVESLKPSVRS